MEVMIVNGLFKTDVKRYKPGEVYIMNQVNKEILQRRFAHFAKIYNKPKLVNTAKFVNVDELIKKATINEKFNNLLIFRAGGIGDLIALTSIIDYFSDINIHFVTQKKKYGALFDWFVNKPKLYDIEDPFITDLSQTNLLTKYSNWARLDAEGVIENGHQENWMELFFSFIEENEPDKELLRPQLRTDRITNIYKSNIQQSELGKKSILVCNKATAMMRSCHASDIIRNLPERIKEEYEVFVYGYNLSEQDRYLIPRMKMYIKIIEQSDLKTFLLDCYDADQLISVDSGALHFREGINKTGIGLYNSFTKESRTKHYQYTSSFNLKSECELMPCFLHETIDKRFCEKSKAGMFAPTCFDSNYNRTLNEQLTKIFETL